MARFAVEFADLRRRWCEREAAGEADETLEQQRGEVELLTEIYGDTIRVLSEEGALPLSLRLELRPAIEGDGPVQIVVPTPEGQVPAGSVDELPPLVVFCALPPGYPNDPSARPSFVLEADHLGFAELEELEAAVRSTCEQYAGEPVLFACFSMLQEQFRQPRRVVLADTVDAMDVALRLLAYARAERDVRRAREVHECPMCFDQVVGTRAIFLDCGHFGCRGCLEQMASLHTAEADVGALRCPVPDCRAPFEQGVVRELLANDAEALKKWEDVSLRRCLESMQDVVFCPRCDSDGTGERVPCIAEEEDDHMARCGACMFIFCGRCKGPPHPGAPCPSADDRLEALEAKAAGAGPEAKAARAELMTLRHLARTTKSCPTCSMAIEKFEGCSKVRCGSCKATFCWRCGKEIEGYDHFATSECRLFDDDEIRRWNQQVKQVDKAQARVHEARFLAQFIDPAKLQEQLRGCPRCRAAVLREGTSNHMRCFSCLTHFCARCYEVLPRNNPGDHFHKHKVCPQHSAD